MEIEVKKQYKGLKIFLIILLVIGVAIFAYYLGTKDVFKKEEVKQETKQEEKEETEVKEEQKELPKQEEIKLSESELDKYLSYVPFNVGDDFNSSAYKSSQVTRDTIDKMALLGMALGYAKDNDYFYQKHLNYKWENIGINFQDIEGNINYVDASKIEPILEKMYNISLSSLNLKQDNDNYTTTYNGHCFSYIENGFAKEACAGGNPLYNFIEDYKVENDTLIIEAYNVDTYSAGEYLLVFNNYKNQEYDTGYELSSNSDIRELCKKYLELNKDKFTKYKHTFKKNSTGYYWYSTEVTS